MRFLADIGVSPRVVAWLRDAGHDVADLREQGMQRLIDRLRDTLEQSSEALELGAIVTIEDGRHRVRRLPR